ncbi:MAG: imidazole glycerol phosphate synthase subunit HisH [Pelagibacteraceae bacterium TMED136]|nr:MAG: imidazole glycerol phosphate synthase subunit HisH [Pelagibacteraceae bacterium TMED136]|tara:strand:- start:5929 stop:6564 length:636 start_codon:yes stop_codon:yes gene_type:complete
MKVAIIDYETGNLKSVLKALELASNNVLKKSNIEIINSTKDLNTFDKVVLPGQGSFKQCFKSLNSIHGILDELTDFVIVKKKPILGICVGMQLFSSFGDEDGGSEGLGWIEGKVKKINLKDISLKLPHMGWNNIQIIQNSKLLNGIDDDSHFYFVHSYAFDVNKKKYVSATTDYSIEIVSAIEKENIFGTQFHPEKSQANGIKILENFVKI